MTTGDTNGTVTEVIGGNLKAGQEVITGQLAGGKPAGSGRRSGAGGGRRQGGGGGGQ